MWGQIRFLCEDSSVGNVYASALQFSIGLQHSGVLMILEMHDHYVCVIHKKKELDGIYSHNVLVWVKDSAEQ